MEEAHLGMSLPFKCVQRVIGHPTVRLWCYRLTFFFFMLFFIGFCAVVPIDAISKASQSSNYALNTFVVVGALVLFGVFSAFITTTRIFILRSSLGDIPKRYVPLDVDDLPHACIKMIEANFDKCEHIRKRALVAPSSVKHAGLSSPDSDVLPPLLRYEDTIRAIGMKLKWDNTSVMNNLAVPKNLSFREIVAFLEENKDVSNTRACREYVELYEELRYSGKLITEEKFVRFMELSLEFIKDINENNSDMPDIDYKAEMEELQSVRKRHTPRSTPKNSDDDSTSTSRDDDDDDNYNNDNDNNDDDDDDVYWLTPTMTVALHTNTTQ